MQGAGDNEEKRDRSREGLSTTIDREQTEVTLTLEGSGAQRGVSLGDFDVFIQSFVRALRDFDRARRDKPTRKSGHPERRAEAVTAFRLVRFAPGSGIATLEPEVVAPDEGALELDEIPFPLENLTALTVALAEESPLPSEVLDDLDRARRAFGDDGSISIELPSDLMDRPVVVDKPKLDRARAPEPDPSTKVTTISGRLHMLDLEPDRIGIRTSAGVEWSCQYDEGLEASVRALIGEVVRVTGAGKLTSPLRGSMKVHSISPVIEVEQSELFTTEVLADTELLARQGIEGPQGIDALSDPEWEDDEADQAYLEAIFGE